VVFIYITAFPYSQPYRLLSLAYIVAEIGLLGSRLRERSSLGLVALAHTDTKDLVGSIQTVLDILRIVQVTEIKA
jgi:hypothetical protein